MEKVETYSPCNNSKKNPIKSNRTIMLWKTFKYSFSFAKIPVIYLNIERRKRTKWNDKTFPNRFRLHWQLIRTAFFKLLQLYLFFLPFSLSLSFQPLHIAFMPFKIDMKRVGAHHVNDFIEVKDNGCSIYDFFLLYR